MKKTKVLVTGGSGFIGGSLRKVFPANFSFVNLDIKENSRDDVRDLERVLKAIRGVDGVVHLAAISRPKWGFEDPHLCFETNVFGTLNVLEAIRRENPKAWLVFGSSREVFGNAKLPADEKTPRQPLNAYGASKASGEDLLKIYARNYGLRCMTLRFCGVYTGVHDIPDRVIPLFIHQALRGVPLTIEGDGKKKFDFVYIGDALDGVLRSIQFVAKQKPGFYEDVTLAVNNPVSLHDLASIVIRLSGSRNKILYKSDRSYDQMGFWGSREKVKKLLGWEPRISLEEGLFRSIRELKLP